MYITFQKHFAMKISWGRDDYNLLYNRLKPNKLGLLPYCSGTLVLKCLLPNKWKGFKPKAFLLSFSHPFARHLIVSSHHFKNFKCLVFFFCNINFVVTTCIGTHMGILFWPFMLCKLLESYVPLYTTTSGCNLQEDWFARSTFERKSKIKLF